VVSAFFFLFLFSPNLSGRRVDVYNTSTHGMALVYGRPMLQGRPYIFSSYRLFFLSLFILLSFFPRLISAVAEWMSAILAHMVWP